MKKKLLFSLVVLMIASISFAQNSQEQVVGSDKDNHGCIVSAGYTYSQLKKECIRVFEQKILLVNADNTMKTALIFNQNKSKVEAFFADSQDLSRSVILKRVGKKGKSWKNEEFTVTKTKKGYSLKKSNKIIFSSK